MSGEVDLDALVELCGCGLAGELNGVVCVEEVRRKVCDCLPVSFAVFLLWHIV